MGEREAKPQPSRRIASKVSTACVTAPLAAGGVIVLGIVSYQRRRMYEMIDGRFM